MIEDIGGGGASGGDNGVETLAKKELRKGILFEIPREEAKLEDDEAAAIAAAAVAAPFRLASSNNSAVNVECITSLEVDDDDDEEEEEEAGSGCGVVRDDTEDND